MSNIWDDAGALPPVLNSTKLAAYLARDKDIINKQDPTTGLTPLAKALLMGSATTVKLLLDNGANPDQKTGDGRTPLYLAADARSQRARMIQLLIDKKPTTIDEVVAPYVPSNTPLMAAIRRGDPAAVKLLVKFGASKDTKNTNGQTAQDLIDGSKRSAADLKTALATTPSMGMGGLLTYIKSWVLPPLAYFRRMRPLSDIFDAASRAFFGIKNRGPEVGQDITEPKTAADFNKNLDNMISRNGLGKIFPRGNPYVKQVAKKAAEMVNEPKNALRAPAQIDMLAKLALYQPVFYLDDSMSMWEDYEGTPTNRWPPQVEIVKKMSEIATRADPLDRGSHVRFINADTPNHNNLSSDSIEEMLTAFPRGTGWTPIGTMLRKHVLDQLVYKDLDAGTLIKRPFLIICITDGFPTAEKAMDGGAQAKADPEYRNEDSDRFRKEIRRLVMELENKGYNKEVVRFSISRIGNITDSDDKREADRFWDGLQSDDVVPDVLYMTPDIMDEKYNLKKDQVELETWLLTVLLSPMQSLLSE
ncbi:hypothetical protein GGR54DRAFT_601838 [Hypoxylon sp. NC1633]|nr:hypothetical protein GGR54DRAFT_601838 [Hypoxylon sp. NC1633]